MVLRNRRNGGERGSRENEGVEEKVEEEENEEKTERRGSDDESPRVRGKSTKTGMNQCDRRDQRFQRSRGEGESERENERKRLTTPLRL